jgi:hypothetical protein
MSFQPVIPINGYAGWRFLQRTIDNQAERHAQAPMAQRDVAHFRANIAKVQSAADLVADRRLLRVALTAFGLGDDLNNRAFVQRILESPMDEPRSFANRLSDRRYAEMARAFGFADEKGPKTGEKGFADRIVKAFHAREFEIAVGEQDESMRLALALRRDLAELAGRELSDDAKWMRILGTPNLRKVFESAFQLPTGFGQIDIDRQVGILKDRTRRTFGEGGVAQFAQPEKMDALVRRFFVGEQLREIQSFRGPSAALTLLMEGQANMAAWRRR